MSTKSEKFTDILIRQEVISRNQLADAEQHARESNSKIGDVLIRLGYATPEEVVQALAEEHGLDYIDLNEISVPPNVIELVPESVARENAILPLAENDDGSLRVIVSDPLDLDTLDKLRFILNRRVDIALAPREAIIDAINRHYGVTEGESADSMLQEFTDTAIDFTETETGDDTFEEAVDESSAPIVRLVHLLISEAVRLRASDIHVEPFEDRVRIRYRIDGVLVERDSPPRRLLGALISRIKILSKIDIAERRRTQDGRIKITVGDREFDLRVSVLPTNHGQSIVMRILDKASISVGMRKLGLQEKDFRTIQSLIRRPNGIVLVTGPTGSGKTTTLYSALNELNRPDRKIITAEDPVEYYLPGINQVEVRHNIGLDFARIIRSMLRQAPNVILVGEMRDAETAEMGIQASLTGHLVFSTLHTNDAPGAITRMVDIGIPSYLVATTVVAILAQRLVRVNCARCKQPYVPSAAQLEAAGITAEMAESATFMRGKGCNRCGKGGFRGRLGIFELLLMSAKMRELTYQGASTQDIRAAAIAEGMHTLYEDGIMKVLDGTTTIDEVFRVAKPEAEGV